MIARLRRTPKQIQRRASMGKWKVHDHGKVTFVWDTDDECEALSQAFSYERLGLYYQTRNGPQVFCHLHLMWGTHVGARFWGAAYYTAPGDSALSMDTTRNRMDALAWTGNYEGI